MESQGGSGAEHLSLEAREGSTERARPTVRRPECVVVHALQNYCLWNTSPIP